MKRWLYTASGALLLIIAFIALAYRAADFFMAPPLYTATALIFIDPEGPTKANRQLVCDTPSFLYSTNILYPVCEALQLPQTWARRAGLDSSRQFTLEYTRHLLAKYQLRIACPKKGKDPIRVIAFSFEPREPMQIANEVEASFKNWMERSGITVTPREFSIDPAIETEKTPYSIRKLLVTIVMVVFCSVTGGLLIRHAPQSPPLIPHEPPVKPILESKY